jgi:hypothetical protein
MRHVNILQGLLTLFSVCACSGADGSDGPQLVEVEDEPAVGMSWQEYRDRAKTAAQGEDYFVAEWDLVFATEDALRRHYDENIIIEKEKLAVFKRLSTGFEPTYSLTKALNLIYCISNSFSNKSTVISDMSGATQDWEKVINVRFRYDSTQDGTCNQNNANVDFAVMPTTAPGMFGCGGNKMMWFAGIDGCPVGGSLVVGVLLVQYGLFPPAPPWHGLTMRGNMRHELGHILGFRHEHPWAPAQGGCGESPNLPVIDSTGRRLTGYDQASVMHYPSCNGFPGLDQTISQLDGIGARTIYGMPASWHVVLW